jgi:hypothetical protein
MTYKQQAIAIGSVIGAVLGAGAAFLLLTAPAEKEPGSEPDHLTGRDLLGLTGTAALLIRKLDDIRRKI